MSITAVTESDLQAYQDRLNQPRIARSGILSELKVLYSRFKENEKNLIDLKYGLQRRQITEQYRTQKQLHQNKLTALKAQYKLIDERIYTVEQQLDQGIPDDLSLMDQLIAEQESIIGLQEKLGKQEAQILEEISQVDVAYGKTNEQLDQQRKAQHNPLTQRFNAYSDRLTEAGKKIRLKVRIYALLPILGLPVIIELIAGIAGVSLSSSTSESHLAIFHPIFFISLILTEIFVAERARNSIYTFLAQQYAKTVSYELMDLLRQNTAQIAKLEQESGMTLSNVLEEVAPIVYSS